jgi:Zn ribbon nucleic-acid-binding protein
MTDHEDQQPDEDQPDPQDTVLVYCARATSPNCRRSVLVPVNELRGDGGGDPAILPVLVPPDHWIGDPDGDGIICEACASPDELAEWQAGLHALEEQGERAYRPRPLTDREHEEQVERDAQAIRIFGPECWPPDPPDES